MAQRKFPSYDDLQRRTDAPPGSAWGVFGDADELGTLNHLTPERVCAAASLVRTGERISLDLPLDTFDPALVPTRKPLQHHIFASNSHHRDEFLDSFYTQSGSQIDGFRHIGHPDHGFYNGADPERFEPGDPYFGVNRFAERGIVGRGVLVDIDSYLRGRGESIDHRGGESIPISTIEAAASAQGVDFSHGDILLLRTGWLRYYREEVAPLPPDSRRDAFSPMVSSGLQATSDTVEWLWDNRFSMLATDNFAVESWPASADSPFVSDAEKLGDVARTSHTGLMHRVLIPLLGMPLGELWDFEALAAACATDSRWAMMLIASPLRLTGGAGSPSNALAIR